MACFLVSGGEAIVATAVRAAVKKSEIAKGVVDAEGNQLTDPSKEGICWTRKLGWLMNMLWGGVILLAIEHMWHGEVVPFPPFLMISSWIRVERMNPATLYTCRSSFNSWITSTNGRSK